MDINSITHNFMEKNRQAFHHHGGKLSKKLLFYRLTRLWQYFSTPLKFLNPS